MVNRRRKQPMISGTLTSLFPVDQPDCGENAGFNKTFSATKTQLLQALAAYAGLFGFAETADLIEVYAQFSILQKKIQVTQFSSKSYIPYTGQDLIACVTQDKKVLLNQLAAVFSAGCRAVVPVEFDVLKGLPAIVRAHIDIREDALISSALKFALVDRRNMIDWTYIASKNNIVVPTIAVSSYTHIPLRFALSNNAGDQHIGDVGSRYAMLQRISRYKFS